MWRELKWGLVINPGAIKLITNGDKALIIIVGHKILEWVKAAVYVELGQLQLCWMFGWPRKLLEE